MFNKRSYVIHRLVLLFSILSLLFLLGPFIAYSQEPCPTGQTKCGTECVNLLTDSRNCGRCGTACPTVANGAAVCIQGLCGFNCSPGWANCDQNRSNGCETNVTTDPRNCGRCGTVCPSGATCRNGICQQACPTGQTKCGTECVNLLTDSRNCGRCGTACPTVANGAAVCIQGLCGFNCSPGWANCDQNRSNGCETNVNTDSRNCGRCGNSCLTGTSCSGGTCVGAGATGTRINLQVERKSCGRCGAECAAGQTCIYVNGTCVLSCQ
jgi:hypothetical protein